MVVVNMVGGVSWEGTLMLVERAFLGWMYLQRRPRLFLPFLPPLHSHPPGVQHGDSW